MFIRSNQAVQPPEFHSVREVPLMTVKRNTLVEKINVCYMSVFIFIYEPSLTVFTWPFSRPRLKR